MLLSLGKVEHDLICANGLSKTLINRCKFLNAELQIICTLKEYERRKDDKNVKFRYAI